MKHRSMLILLETTLLLTQAYANPTHEKESAQQATFIVQPCAEHQPKSTRGIKEAMGDSFENIIRQCASLQHELAQLHIHLSTIQTHALSSVRNLLDNTGPTKSLKKEELREELSALQSAEHHLSTQLQETKTIAQHLSTSPEKPLESLKMAHTSMKKQQTIISQVKGSLTAPQRQRRS
jgi:hypothetical protein